MNLLGLMNLGREGTLTLSKLNAQIRLFANKNNINLSIIQTHSESKAVSYLHKNKNKLKKIILSPGAWSNHGYILLKLLRY